MSNVDKQQMSRYGAISRTVPGLAPSAKVFLVGDSDDTTYGIENLAAAYPVDQEGVVRVFSTPQAAVNAASGGRGDVVLLAPGSSFSLTRADTWATADVSVIGLGTGAQRPVITYDTASSVIHFGASGIRLSNVILQADVTAVAQGLDLDSGFEGHTIDNCKFTFNATGDNFISMADVNTANTTIEDNEFIAEDTIGAGRAINIFGGEPDNLTIRRNHFYGQFDTLGDDTTDCAAIVTINLNHDSGDTIINNLRLESNTFVSTDTAAALLVSFRSGATTVRGGIATDNRFVSYDTASADTAQVLFQPAAAGGANKGVLPLQNYFIDGDSDVLESIVGLSSKFPGIQST